MLAPRQTIFRSALLWTLLLTVLGFGVGFALSFATEDLRLQLLGALLFTLLGFLGVLHFKITHPIKVVMQEMKALLTGKSYRRILTQRTDEVGVLAHFFNEVTRNLENISTDVRQHQALKKEIDLAQSIQRDLLPTKLPSLPGLDLAAKTRPASEIGGDAYNFYERDGRHFIYIGDSTGHGVPAGLIMIMVDVLMDTFIAISNDLVEMMIQINRFLKPNLRTTMFMTIILMEWIPGSSKFTWVGAGHEYLIHVRPSTDTITSVPAGGIALGMLEDNRALCKAQDMAMQPGDFLVLFTDGITEAKNVAGQVYGQKRLEDFLRLHTKGETSASDLFEKIAVDVSRFMEGHRQEDDMTLIIFKCLTPVGTAAGISAPPSLESA